ncbi:hypothetical protein EHI8A_000150 [Entamoeba histolytica HM-1:IMSS-B]|uniref:Uncharacterized protein n=6 Tax=Entamoeba histolytica TaxID=5759 RepID=C4LSK9_ENTH1|nr:hypothetical protein EHI_151680 [Entamoeba histolytica HM-1:IMSS]EMD46638.1 Hypothetical protein EHI5A_000380 [Entamoeba histolytica KU27]EMH75698.1 hypothetical protein EHI8A_000150 [Entamoeba histolytica HM-1:IMSS-B]EMS17285.1 hypothetical protein KM1_000740 [Entamoeba histolytica HM-3:IMSS]ENY59917.1 hypothetical protein EHI7A_000380 [Entamoeba histolytica HM-1:IMSS-A]GAT91415.1 hypothetical protein CL6EHI_151680 [Entamoeba histolytica]|eukprot:XP_657413.1 hypothetical protein EHI_151680 [Entamoeba histolytica HM-1:IMSS]
MLRSKYKKNLYALLEEKEFNVAAFNKLHHSVELTPVKLPKVFRILEDYITKNFTNEVNVVKATRTMGELSNNCREHLALMDERIVRVIRQCLGSANPKIKQAGMQLLGYYVKACNETSIRANFDEIKNLPLDLTKSAVNDTKDSEQALGALKDCVLIFQMVSEIDQILGSKTVLRVIFDCLNKNETNEAAKDIVLDIVSSITDKITMTKFMDGIKDYLDSSQKWENKLSQELIVEISGLIKVTMKDVMIQSILDHIPKTESISVKLSQLKLVQKLVDGRNDISADLLRKIHSLFTFSITSYDDLENSEAKEFINEVFDLIQKTLELVNDDLIKSDFCSFVFSESDNSSESKRFLNTVLLIKIVPLIKRDVIQRIDRIPFIKFLSNLVFSNHEIRSNSVKVIREFLFGSDEVITQQTNDIVFSTQIKYDLAESLLQSSTKTDELVQIYDLWRDIILGGELNELVETIPLIGYMSKRIQKLDAKHRNYVHYIILMLLKTISIKYNIEELATYLDERMKGIERYYDVTELNLKINKATKEYEEISQFIVKQSEIVDILKASDISNKIPNINKLSDEITSKDKNKHKATSSKLVSNNKSIGNNDHHNEKVITTNVDFNTLKKACLQDRNESKNETKTEQSFEGLMKEYQEIKKQEDDLIKEIEEMVKGVDDVNTVLDAKELYGEVNWVFEL